MCPEEGILQLLRRRVTVRSSGLHPIRLLRLLALLHDELRDVAWGDLIRVVQQGMRRLCDCSISQERPFLFMQLYEGPFLRQGSLGWQLLRGSR